MTTVRTRIESLELEAALLEDDLVELEKDGIYGGDEYDSLLDSLREIDHDLDQLRRLDEDDEY